MTKGNIRYPCPSAGDFDCERTFSTKATANRHVKGGPPHNCPKTYSRPDFATKHAEAQHNGGGYICSTCGEHSATSQHANDHKRSHEYPHLCRHSRCLKRFESLAEAMEHENDPHPGYLLCPVVSCKDAVAEKRFVPILLALHIERIHDKYEHVVPKAEQKSVDANTPHQHLDFYKLLRLNNAEAAAGSTGTNEEGAGGEPSDVEVSCEKEADDEVSCEKEADDEVSCEKEADDEVSCEKEADDDDLDVDGFDLEGLANCGDEGPESSIGNETDLAAEVLDRNYWHWDRKGRGKVCFTNLGLTCIGPSIIEQNLVFEACPRNITIDFHTAPLVIASSHYVPTTGRHTLGLSPRCVSCTSYVRTTKLLAHLGFRGHPKNCTCIDTDCERKAFSTTGLCWKHLQPHQFEAYRKKRAKQLDAARDVFRLMKHNVWSWRPDHLALLESALHSRSKRAGPRVVFIDDEFSMASGQLLEVAIIDAETDAILVNTTVNHRNRLDHVARGSGNPYMRELISRSQARKIYAPRQGINHWDVDTIAETLRKVGISPKTIFLAWHTGATDLRLLRELLEKAGHTGILPPDENCIPLLRSFMPNRRFAPKGVKFSMSLEVLFPVMYPEHDLVGQNHQALVDYQQTSLVCEAFDQLCKPVAERDARWQPEAPSRQIKKPVAPSRRENPRSPPLKISTTNMMTESKKRDPDDNEGPQKAKRVLRSSGTGR
ncbi:hypothetical protein CONLIGDRAFT_645810 [Coniochaeta ligniaria NRRL 30616]|uniref:C2H2-type domain-containing protein n=1 Tax=Coniochaeta ligniaria NRRL 30616 TaxID=1408157 RepID=A0A1J7JE90_9PEZI|nr:hypothetical protein CONLIGDRAFT_645810 [Coniochaeta ligniaria NRRL 30616]